MPNRAKARHVKLSGGLPIVNCASRALSDLIHTLAMVRIGKVIEAYPAPFRKQIPADDADYKMKFKHCGPNIEQYFYLESNPTIKGDWI